MPLAQHLLNLAPSPPPVSLSGLADVAQDILDFGVLALGVRAPARRYLVPGISDITECEQITVSWTSPGLYPSSEGFPIVSRQSAKRPQVTVADFLLECTRCVPPINSETGTYPDPSDLTTTAIEIMTDGETLYCAFAKACQSKTAPLFGGCRLVSLGGAAPYGPSGGMGGVRLPMTVQVGCEEPEGS